jgi:DNA-binding NtrC family response regulator
MEAQKKIRVLVIDDEDTFRTVLAGELEESGYAAHGAATAEEALTRLKQKGADVVLLDIRLPGMDGLKALARIRALDAPPEVIMLTGHATVDRAVDAMKQGAFDFLTKPCPLEQVDAAIQKAAEHSSLKQQNRILRDGWQLHGSDLAWKSKAMESVVEQIQKVAATDSTVLIEGESGSGKEVVAQAIHKRSHRASEPFVVVDCTALREELLESELFGHERGAFTGAVATKHGLFEVANHGTLFLDEAGELPPALQAKLLRVIETRGFRRVGGTSNIFVDVRILAATQHELRAAVEEKRFREDLYYRLNVLRIRVPPLRERLKDIPLLAELFLSSCTRSRKTAAQIGEEAMALLLRHAWPGNVRELKNVIERAVILAEGPVLTPRDVALFDPLSTASLSGDSGDLPPFREFKARYFERLLQATHGNKREAARLAGVSERTLHRFLKSPSRRS